MRPWLFVVLLAGCLASPTADPLSVGVGALHEQGADGARVVELAVALGEDPRDWQGRDLLATVAVPPPSSDPIEALYEIMVVAQGGAELGTWHDPVRGEVDLAQQLLDNIPAAINASNDAVQSFQLLAMAAAGFGGHEATDDLRDAIIDAQHPDGAWGCGPWVGPECTSYALRALAVSGGIPAQVRDDAVAYIESRRDGEAYSDPLNGADVQITAAAVRGLVAAGASVDPAVIEGLVAQQAPDGMWHRAGQPSLWVTTEVLLALADAGH